MVGDGLEDAGSERPEADANALGLTSLNPPPKLLEKTPNEIPNSGQVIPVTDSYIVRDIDQVARNVEETLNEQGAAAALNAVRNETNEFQRTHPNYTVRKEFVNGLNKRLTDDGALDALQEESAKEAGESSTPNDEQSVSSVDQVARSVEETLNEQGAAAALNAVRNETNEFQRTHPNYTVRKEFVNGLNKRLTNDGVLSTLQEESAKEAGAE